MKKIASCLMAIVFLSSPLTSMAAASSNNTTASASTATVVLNVNTAPEITTYTLPNGKVFSDPQLVANELSTYFAGKTNRIIEMNVNQYDHARKINSLAPSNQSSFIALGWGFGFKVGSYYVRVSLEPGYLGGCIGKNVWHVGLMISKQGSSTPLADLHLAAWKDKGGPQLGAYNSGSRNGFCYKTAFNYNTVYNVIFNASAAVIGTSLGYAVANSASSAVYGELGFLLI